MIIIMDENAKKVKIFKMNPITEKENNIQFENVMIKMEPNTQDFEESFDNLLVNQDDIKIEFSQNDIKLTSSTIKKEKEHQNIQENLHEKCTIFLQENILEMCDSEIDATAAKLEENNDPLYFEKCSGDLLANLKEIKIDNVDNDIETLNSEINMQYKSEDNVNPLEDQDEDYTDKEVNVSYKILKAKQKRTLLSKKSKQKMCGVVNRKDKIVKKYECSICKKKFPQSYSLKCHMRIHTGEKPNKCDVCHKKFNRSSDLKKHMRIHTSEKPYECDLCQKKFSYPCNLKEHMIIHTGDKPYECDICQQKFTRSYHLMCHMRIHTGEKPHACDVCQRNFTHLANLVCHKRIHTGEKPYTCDVCQKKFSQSSSLMCHKRIHTGEKPYACEVCQKKFNLSSSLIRHKRIHTGE